MFTSLCLAPSCFGLDVCARYGANACCMKIQKKCSSIEHQLPGKPHQLLVLYECNITTKSHWLIDCFTPTILSPIPTPSLSFRGSLLEMTCCCESRKLKFDTLTPFSKLNCIQ